MQSDENYVSEQEQVLTERYLRAPREKQPVAYEFTRDMGYLHQYYALRERMRLSVWRPRKNEAVEDVFDKAGNILIARAGNFVVAGCRLTFSSPRKEMLLPVESKGFSLKQALKNLNLEYRKYAELSDLVMEPAYQTEKCMKEIFRRVSRKLIANKVDYLMSVGSLADTRLYRSFLGKMGINLTVRADVELPTDYENGTKSYLMILAVDPQQAEKNMEKSKQEDLEHY